MTTGSWFWVAFSLALLAGPATRDCHRWAAMVESIQQHPRARETVRRNLGLMDEETRAAVSNALQFAEDFERRHLRTPGYVDAFRECRRARQLGMQWVICCGVVGI